MLAMRPARRGASRSSHGSPAPGWHGGRAARLERHRETARTSASGEEARRIDDVVDIIDEEVQRRLHAAFAAEHDGVGPLLAAVRSGSVDPYSAAVQVLSDPSVLGVLLAQRGPHGRQ